MKTVANWDYLFKGVEIREIKDISKIYGEVEEKYVLPLKELLFLEKSGIQSDSAIVRLKDGKTWVECEVSVIYDQMNVPTDKVIRFKNVSTEIFPVLTRRP